MGLNDRIIGIVGGMGPEAGIQLLSRVTARTDAMTDKDHLHSVLISYPGQITDRSAFLNGMSAENPAYSIAEIIRKLEMVGAEVIGIACNTSYAPPIYDVIEQELGSIKNKVKLLHMPYETCQYLKQHYKDVRMIGVMTTNGTYQTGLYSDMLQTMGYQVVLPDFSFQDQVIHRMIYDPSAGIKANAGRITGLVRSLLNTAINFFIDHGAEAIILGCTEFSLLSDLLKTAGIPVLDTVDILAAALIREATRVNHPASFSLLPENENK